LTNFVLGVIIGEEWEDMGLVVFVEVEKDGAEEMWWRGELGRRRVRGKVWWNGGIRRGEEGSSESSGMTDDTGVLSRVVYSVMDWEMLRPV
jgi:hypothetical protein